MSPVNDGYGKPGLIPAGHRIRMARIATAGLQQDALGWTVGCSF